jgi:hypothetical protein
MSIFGIKLHVSGFATKGTTGAEAEPDHNKGEMLDGFL